MHCCFARCNKFLAPSSLIPKAAAMAACQDKVLTKRILEAARLPTPAWSEAPHWRGIDQGRSRWLPDGSALAYIDQARDGSYGVYVQEFAPGADTYARRRRLGAPEPDLAAESLGISPDGAFITISYREQLFDLLLADGVPDIPVRSQP